MRALLLVLLVRAMGAFAAGYTGDARSSSDWRRWARLAAAG